MLLSSDGTLKKLSKCHNGEGIVYCFERLADYTRPSGIRFVHEDRIPPGASIGLHAHDDDEELYIILSGTGELAIDSGRVPVGPGDISVTRDGHSHALHNTGESDLKFYVIGIKANSL